MKYHAYHVPGVGFCIQQPAYGVWEGYGINIPDELIYGLNRFHEPLIVFNKKVFPLRDVLTACDGNPCLFAFDGEWYKVVLE